jgi:hypothetical protein
VCKLRDVDGTAEISRSTEAAISIRGAMGYVELFAQQTFAEETERITGGAAGWSDPPEIRLERVQSDGFLVIRQPQLLEHLGPPWSVAQPHDEVMLELKLPGNHVDRKAVERALLRRQARQLQRVEEQDASWRSEEPLWLVAPHMPQWLVEMRQPVCFAPGCYWVEPQWQRFLWIAANELPLRNELIPFLMVRSGRALDAFGRWVAPRRTIEWVLHMVRYTKMSMPTREELLRRFPKVDDPEIQARTQHMIDVLLEVNPQAKRQIREEGAMEGRQEGQLTAARAALRRVLARRQLTLSKNEDARVEACTDLATLERWIDQAVTAASLSDALA